MDPHRPIAFARSAGSVNTLVTIAIATGFIMLPPTACSARNAISQSSPGASEQASEPRAKSASPIWNTRRRPTRSPTEPDSISRPATTSR